MTGPAGKKAGSAYVMVLFVLLVLNTVILALINETRRDRPGAHQFLYNMQAHYLAEAGLRAAERDIRNHLDDPQKKTQGEIVLNFERDPNDSAAWTSKVEDQPLRMGNFSYAIETLSMDETRARYRVKAWGAVPLSGTRPLAKKVLIAVYEQVLNGPLRLLEWRSLPSAPKTKVTPNSR